MHYSTRVDEGTKCRIILAMKIEARTVVGRGEKSLLSNPGSELRLGEGGAYSFAACLSHLTIDHASLLRRSTVATPKRDTSNVWALVTLFPYTT